MIGRLAPSPTGLLHAGNLFAAAIAAADVIQQGGELVLRIEDIDSARCIPGVDAQIMRHLSGEFRSENVAAKLRECNVDVTV